MGLARRLRRAAAGSDAEGSEAASDESDVYDLRHGEEQDSDSGGSSLEGEGRGAFLSQLSWLELRDVEQAAAVRLGYDKASWDEGPVIITPWEELSASQRDAARLLGGSRGLWTEMHETNGRSCA